MKLKLFPWFVSALRCLRARQSRMARELAQMLEELEALNQEFAPYRASYIALLREAGQAVVRYLPLVCCLFICH